MSGREAHSVRPGVPQGPSGSSDRRRPRELVATEPALKSALAPFSREARAKGIELVCELVPGLGETLLASRRVLATALARALTKALEWPGAREIRVRLSRQRAGFTFSDTVLLTVMSDLFAVEPIHVELVMPSAGEPTSGERVAEGARLLVVSPSHEAARVIVGSARRAGAAARAVTHSDDAWSELRSARAEGQGYDVVVIDDAVDATGALIDALRDDATLGGASSVIATASPTAAGVAAWVDRGATALLEKPVLPAELGASIASVLVRGSARTPARLPSGRLRILLGEDDPVIARLTTRLLEGMGHSVFVEASGRKVVSRLASESFDVLVLDVGLEDLDGITVARLVKAQRETTGEGPSRVLFASAARIDPTKVAAAGVDGVLEKPLDAKKLAAFIPSVARQAHESSTRLVAQSVNKAVVLDLDGLRGRTGGDESLVRELLSDFLTHSAGWSATLREACESGAFTEAGRLAHRLRGALSGLGATSASMAAEAVERHVTVGTMGPEARARVASALPELERRLEAVRAAARAHLSAPRATP